jgi:hypothetical protein
MPKGYHIGKKGEIRRDDPKIKMTKKQRRKFRKTGKYANEEEK